MNVRAVVRQLLCACAALLLLGLSWWALTGGVRDLQQAGTRGQVGETAIRLGCGLLSIAVVVTRFRWRALARRVRIGWVVTLVLTAGVSALGWGPPMPHVALLFAVVALVLASAILWALGPVTSEQRPGGHGRFL